MINKFNKNELITPMSDISYARPALSFCISSLRLSQAALELIDAINTYSTNNSDLDFYIYNINPDLPIMLPYCAVYSRTELLTHKGPIIALDPFSCHSLLANKFCDIYYYLYDPILPFMIDTMIKDEIFSNSKIKFIARNNEHRQLINNNTNAFCHRKLIKNISENTLKDFIGLINE